MTKLVAKALLFAKEKHAGQVDDDLFDYFVAHVLPVYELVTSIGGNRHMQAAALLHDTLEDTNTTYEELVENFGSTVANLVKELTHEGKPDNIGYYFPHLVSRDAIVIKLADRMSNLMRMDSWPIARQKAYLRKTQFWKMKP